MAHKALDNLAPTYFSCPILYDFHLSLKPNCQEQSLRSFIPAFKNQNVSILIYLLN